jgi:6-phosphogluconate dehydrogenase
MARRLLRGGHEVVAYNRTRSKADELATEGAKAVGSLAEAVAALRAPRVAWVMLPAGDPTDQALDELAGLLSPGDMVVEGGNSRYTDDLRRAPRFAEKSIHYVDAGVSGGIWGLAKGYCTMIGGPKEAFAAMEPLLTTLAPPQGYMYCGPTGAGHFTKMIHNAIEYGMMQAYAEGFAVIEASPYKDDADLSSLCHLWNQGSVVRSWLLELAEDLFRKDPNLSFLGPEVEDSGEGRWTMLQAIEQAVPVPVLAASIFERFRSRQANSFADRVLAGLRNEFGGHQVSKPKS